MSLSATYYELDPQLVEICEGILKRLDEQLGSVALFSKEADEILKAYEKLAVTYTRYRIKRMNQNSYLDVVNYLTNEMKTAEEFANQMYTKINEKKIESL